MDYNTNTNINTYNTIINENQMFKSLKDYYTDNEPLYKLVVNVLDDANCKQHNVTWLSKRFG